MILYFLKVFLFHSQMSIVVEKKCIYLIILYKEPFEKKEKYPDQVRDHSFLLIPCNSVQFVACYPVVSITLRDAMKRICSTWYSDGLFA